jgi:hypothetical protein
MEFLQWGRVEAAHYFKFANAGILERRWRRNL